MELGKNMSDEDTNLMLPQLAGDELLVEGVRTEKKRFRRLIWGVLAIAVISAAVFTYLDLTGSKMRDGSVESEAESMSGNLDELAGRLGGSTDDHGCLTSAGYSWCESSSVCIRVWETSCTAIES
mmetsp:Transcript_13453/g.31374  ORF Transcript_13453/g.31374 Transcript_13453/m.31374 type:complete len:125 (-) Transcript_13453:540-914(-)